jgi:hypothetical protein
VTLRPAFVLARWRDAWRSVDGFAYRC